tara:strand:- start:37469 stop:38332 length:864 start_codon:yes stop_codon:yes gene_type:complete
MRNKVLILGANGLIGSNISKFLMFNKIETICGVRNYKKKFSNKLKYIFYGNLEDSKNIDILKKKIFLLKPNFIINCCGITKHYEREKFKINFNLVKKILKLNLKFKFIHLSTDCIFSGIKGNYYENSISDAKDDYGISKAKIEKFIKNKKNILVLRTSTIGHEVNKNKGLLEWFLKNNNKRILGFKNAIFSGPTTFELSKIIYKYVIKKKVLINGIYNISSMPISKYDLLMIIKKIYKKKIFIKENTTFKVNRSLNCSKFIKKTKYRIKDWHTLIKESKRFNNERFF